MQETTVTQVIGGKEVTIKTGKLAKQANGAVTIQCGKAMILATAVMAKQPKEGIDFFPLTIEYAEKMYAAGKIPGGFFKREAKPSTESILTARLIDRPIRPCFPKHFHHEVQIILTVISHDPEIEHEFMAIIGASAALSVSDIPFAGPVGAALVCEVDGELKVNPSTEEVDRSTLHIVVAGTKDAVLMIEAGASEVSEERILEAIKIAHESIKESVSMQEQLVSKAPQKEKVVLAQPQEDPALESAIKDFLGDKILQNMQSGKKQEIDAFLSELEKGVCENFVDPESDNEALVKRLYNTIKKDQIREVIIEKRIRPDGRALDEIRPIFSEVGLLPSAHGSALFTRGETQSLGVVTLGTNADEQIIDGLDESSRSPYYFHYNFPPFSVGECGRLMTGRRELGHGALAQRALQAVLPGVETFPYTIRIVSEILESNGSSSMASVCSGSLALMDCGVPISGTVSGIAMGLLIKDGDYIILSDIQGLEDHYGDMDFKVAGTINGITALQLDIKVGGLSEEILREALAQANRGRLQILETMNTVISAPREGLSENAPQIEFMHIDPEKVGALIGPGGKMIKKIEEESSATVYVVDGTKGEVSISAANSKALEKAKYMVNLIVRDPEKGDVFEGTVVKIVNFGAFIELGGGGKEALLHISKIADHRVEKVEDYLSVGQPLKVKVEEVDGNGRISVSRMAES